MVTGLGACWDHQNHARHPRLQPRHKFTKLKVLAGERWPPDLIY